MIAKRVEPIARKSFLNKMKEFDPNEIFMNDFGRRLKGVGTKITMDPKVTHCALLDNCVCRKNSDCADRQTCSTIEGYPDYPVCKSPPQSPEDSFLHPDPFSMEGLTLFARHVQRLVSKGVSRVSRVLN